MDKRDREGAESHSASGSPLSGSDAPFRALVEGIRDYGIVLLDREGNVCTWNAGAGKLHGYATDEILGRHFSVFYAPAELARGYPMRGLEIAARTGRFEDEGWRVRKDGMRFWARVVINALRDADGALYGYGKVFCDLTRERQREEELRHSEERGRELREQALKDPLTGVFNRRHLIEFLRDAMDGNPETKASIFAIDVDHFKEVNDHFGHEAGDEVLRRVADLANQLCRDVDRVFRLGGDEFLVHLPGVGLEAARAIAERLRDAVQKAQIIPRCAVSVSIGVAQLTQADSAETWMHRADGALYAAKHAGRNRVV